MGAELPSSMRASQWTMLAGGLEKNLKVNTQAALPKQAKSLPADHTLVKVSYATLNPVDYKLAELPLIGSYDFSKPAIPGLDFSGKVVSTTLPHLKAGELVFGTTATPKFGALAEYTVAPKQGVVSLPNHVPLDQAACVGIVGLTAYQCIIPFIEPGAKVLINGGSGGTGMFGIQIAKAAGCEVTTTCSSANVDFCKSLGADTVIDYRTENVVDALKRSGTEYDLIVDNVFADSNLYWDSHHYLKPEGKFITIAGTATLKFITEVLKIFFLPRWLGGGKRKFSFVSASPNAEQYVQIAKWMEEGKVKVEIEKMYELEDAGKGYKRLKSGRVRGKLVVKVAGE